MNKFFWIAMFASSFLWLANAKAVEVGVGVPGGVAGGDRGESRETMRNYDRLERDARSIRIAQRHLEKLSRQEVPDKLDEPAQAEWRQQSEWLEKQADRLDDLVGELDRLLRERDFARTEFAYFDYQRIKADIGFVVDGMKGKAENYAVKSKAAAQRQKKAIKIIARAD